MSLKKHVLLVISNKPIDTGKIDECSGVEHFITAEVKVSVENRQMVARSLKDNAEASGAHGSGPSVSCAIVSFLNEIVSSHWYFPFREQMKKMQEK